MKTSKKKSTTPEASEYTDENGTTWIQTSTEDLFSIKELSDVIESIERETKEGEIILARIDFHKVNKEYFEAAAQLQQKLRKQNELLKKTIADAREKIERKNKKLRELIAYIKKLHLLLAHLASGEDLSLGPIPPDLIKKATEAASLLHDASEPEYEEVEEIPLPFDAPDKRK